LRLRLAAGRTFRGPTLADLYYPFDGFVVGNPLLRPEQAWALDAGVEVVIRPGLTARATVFWNDVRDLIIYVPNAAFVFSPQNIGTATIRGASFELDGAVAPQWVARASMTWMHATDGASGADLPNRPRLAGTASLTRLLAADAALTASIIAVGERYADTAGMIRLPAYLTAAVTAQVPLGAGMQVRVSIQNLFDARYEPLQGYPTPGRTVFGELVIRR
jgi:vitamin B12 transporter